MGSGKKSARKLKIKDALKLLTEEEAAKLVNDEEIKARDAFWQGVVSLRKGAYKEAVQHLESAKLSGREDQPLKYFLERAEAAEKRRMIEAERLRSANERARIGDGNLHVV